LLANIVERQNKLVIFSTHNLDLVEKYCDGMLIIKNSQLSKVSSVKSDKSIVFKRQLEKVFEDEI
jgi:ABC-type Na+ transport system ATPase subunit NatA